MHACIYVCILYVFHRISGDRTLESFKNGKNPYTYKDQTPYEHQIDKANTIIMFHCVKETTWTQ